MKLKDLLRELLESRQGTLDFVKNSLSIPEEEKLVEIAQIMVLVMVE